MRVGFSQISYPWLSLHSQMALRTEPSCETYHFLAPSSLYFLLTSQELWLIQISLCFPHPTDCQKPNMDIFPLHWISLGTFKAFQGRGAPSGLHWGKEALICHFGSWQGESSTVFDRLASLPNSSQTTFWGRRLFYLLTVLVLSFYAVDKKLLQQIMHILVRLWISFSTVQ